MDHVEKLLWFWRATDEHGPWQSCPVLRMSDKHAELGCLLSAWSRRKGEKLMSNMSLYFGQTTRTQSTGLHVESDER